MKKILQISILITLAMLFGCNNVALNTETKSISPNINTAQPGIKASEGNDSMKVQELILETSYKEYFTDEKCRKSFAEAGSNDSPCVLTIILKVNGEAVKIIETKGYENTTKKFSVLEKQTWSGTISTDQFNKISKDIANNEMFKDWKAVDISRKNSQITIKDEKNSRDVMSYVDEKTTVFLEMIHAFKEAEKNIEWKKD